LHDGPEARRRRQRRRVGAQARQEVFAGEAHAARDEGPVLGAQQLAPRQLAVAGQLDEEVRRALAAPELRREAEAAEALARLVDARRPRQGVRELALEDAGEEGGD